MKYKNYFKSSFLLYITALFFIFIVLFNCGDINKPYLPERPAFDILAEIKTIADTTSYSEYKMVSGENFSETFLASDVYYFENTPFYQGGPALSDSIPLYEYLTDGQDRIVFQINAGSPRNPNVGVRSGEEPMMNLFLDAMLYFGRKYYSEYNENQRIASIMSGKNITIANHNGGGMWNPNEFQSYSYSINDFLPGQPSTNISRHIRHANSLVVVEVSPESLKRFIEFGVSKMNNSDGTAGESGSDGFFTHYSGLYFNYSRNPNYSTFKHDGSKITNPGERVRDIWVLRPGIDEYHPNFNPYDTMLYNALNYPNDNNYFIKIVENGNVISGKEDFVMYMIMPDFMSLTIIESRDALGITGVDDPKVLLFDQDNNTIDVLNTILSNENYTLYHRLQGRIRVVE